MVRQRLMDRVSGGSLWTTLVLAVIMMAATVFTSVPASAAEVGTELAADRQLGSGDWLQSGNYRFVMQTDGNLVLYGPAGPLWATYTNSPGASLTNQSDGNLVVYTADRRAVVWSSRTNGRGAGRLVMQGDGNVVLYGPGGPTWSTYTNGGMSKMKAAGVVAYARNQLGKSYVYGATGPDTFDCSGLTMRAYQSVGTSLERTTYRQVQQGWSVNRAELQPGDLVFYNNNGHVAIYVGNDEVIQALNARYKVGYFSITYGDPISGQRRYA
jgi:hypothetical protein